MTKKLVVGKNKVVANKVIASEAMSLGNRHFFQKDLLISLIKIFIFSRFIIALCIYFSQFNDGTARSIVDILSTEWDSGYFIGQATTGKFGGAFFPFYPILIKIFSLNGILSIPLVAIVLNQIMLFVSMYTLAIYLIEKGLTEVDAKFGSVILAISPMSVNFAATLSESTFLLLIIFSLYFLYKDKMYIVAILGMCASATRAVGLAVVLLILYKQIRERKFSRHTLLQLLIAASGLLLYSLYCHIYLGDFLSFIHDEANWGRTGWITVVDNPLQYLFQNLFYESFTRDSIAFVLAVFLTGYMFFRNFIIEAILNLLFILPGFIAGSKYGIFYTSDRLDTGIITFYIGMAIFCSGKLERKYFVITLFAALQMAAWVRWLAGHSI